MKVLVVSSYLPYPLYSGGQVRLYNLIKELSDKHEITLVCERRPNETDADVKAVEKICKKVITVPRKKQWSLGNVFKAGMSSQSFLVTGHTLPEMQNKIKEELQKERYDLIHVETYYVMQNIPETNIPIVLVEHNIEYKVYERFKNKAPVFLRPFLEIDITKIKKEEETFWKRAAKVVAVSKDDQKVMEGSGINADVVANGVNTEEFSSKDLGVEFNKKEKKILFIGDFKWLQNRDSAAFIINEIWPRVRSEVREDLTSPRLRGVGRLDVDVKLWFVARSIPESIKSLTDDPHVLFDEASSAMATPEIFREASVLLAPIRVGGGTSYKILESMSCGTPVVTMPLSANALGAKDGHELLIGDNAETLAEKTVEVLQKEDLYKKISISGRVFIEKNYTWKEIAKVLDVLYRNLKFK